MDSIFCCSSFDPFKPRIIDNEAKFKAFLSWAPTTKATSVGTVSNGPRDLPLGKSSCFVIQVVRQVNYGPLESKRYFAKAAGMAVPFNEVTEQDLINTNYEKVNSYKNFKCVAHNRFFELNLYQKDPVNRHHWRANIARPTTKINIPPKITKDVGDVSKVNLPSKSFEQLEAASAAHLDSIQSVNKQSNVNSTFITYSTPTMFSPTAGKSQSLEVDTAMQGDFEKGPVESREGMDGWVGQGSEEPENEEAGYDTAYIDLAHLLTRSVIPGYLSDNDQFGGEDYSNSCDSQFSKDFTACSASNCGNCGN